MKLQKKELIVISLATLAFIQILALIINLPSLRIVDTDDQWNTPKSEWFTQQPILEQEKDNKAEIDDTQSGPNAYLQIIFGVAEPVLVFLLPGYMFNQMCLKFQYE